MEEEQKIIKEFVDITKEVEGEIDDTPENILKAHKDVVRELKKQPRAVERDENGKFVGCFRSYTRVI